MNRLIEHMSNADYRASKDVISKSGLDRIAISPAHYKWYLDNPTVETPDLIFGRAFHTMILEPEMVDQEIIIMPDAWQTKKECGRAIADQKDEFILRHRGKTMITADMMEMAKGMAQAVEEHAAARVLLRKDAGKAEISAFWQDEVTGVDCRARFDWLRDDGLIVDLKTTRCAKPGTFEKLALNHRYHVQAAFYMEAYRRITGSEPIGFAFVAVDKEPPYCTCAYVAQPDFIELGRREYIENIRLYAKCRKSNDWPGYPEVQLMQLSLPKWAEKLLNQGDYL